MIAYDGTLPGVCGSAVPSTSTLPPTTTVVPARCASTFGVIETSVRDAPISMPPPPKPCEFASASGRSVPWMVRSPRALTVPPLIAAVSDGFTVALASLSWSARRPPEAASERAFAACWPRASMVMLSASAIVPFWIACVAPLEVEVEVGRAEPTDAAGGALRQGVGVGVRARGEVDVAAPRSGVALLMARTSGELVAFALPPAMPKRIAPPMERASA